MAAKKIPNAEQATKPKPSAKQNVKELPQVGIPENSVVIAGQLIEIKPTELKYMRNRTAYFYKALDLYPLVDILAADKGEFDEERDGDKCVMDFLIAATNNEDLIVTHYDELNNETVEKILEIFKRVNKFTEKETNRKNLLAATRVASQSNKA